MASATVPFLLEIGFEEMPAPWLPGLAEQARTRLGEIAGRERLSPANVEVLFTPRRLVLAADVAARQDDREEPVWGPALAVARDASGAWTKAALGFAKKNGVEPDALAQAPKDPKSPGDLNLLFVKKTAGRPASEVAPALVAALLRSFSFPKRMNWDAWIDDGKGALPFGRPIRWLLALLGGEVVPFTIYALESGAKGAALVTSGRATEGHRFLPRGAGREPIVVHSLAELTERLGARGVVLDPAERARRVRTQVEALGGSSVLDHPLLDEWRDLVEHPTVMAGTVPAEFGHLPPAILQTVLEHHQKYVTLPGAPTRFAAITNADPDAREAVVRGMERVVVARLRDAAFFLAEDAKRPLAARVDDLAGVTFHQALGTYREKADRLVRLVGEMALPTEARGPAAEAARLAKADLTTLMVREFTELQGVVGGLYLRRDGASEVVADAVALHYEPLSIDRASAPAGRLEPAVQPVWAAVALADKLDTLAGYFGVGLLPSGSADPFGLRRAAQGAVRIALDFWTGEAPDLRRLVRAALAGLGPRLARPGDEVAKELDGFLLERLRTVLASRDPHADEVDAVLGAREPEALDDPREAEKRLAALHAVRAEAGEDFAHLAVAFKRARNILGPEAAAEVEEAALHEEAEKALLRAVQASPTTGGYAERLRALAALRAPVDRFFDDVLVMAEDEAVRKNRLGLLARTLSLFYRIADISRLGGAA